MKVDLGFVKSATELVSSTCSSFAVGTVLGCFAPANNPIAKVAFFVAGAAIGGMVGKEAGEYMGDTVVQTCELIDSIKENYSKE